MRALASGLQPVTQPPLDVRMMNATSALLMVAVLLMACAAGLWWRLRDPAFAIQRIVVRGQTVHNDAASLRERVLPRLSGNFFTLNMAQVQTAFQSAPWVERAVVWRRWPGLLDVVLQEHEPYARWGASGQRMLDVNGQLFNTGSNNARDPDTSALPTLTGPDGQSATVLAMYGKLSSLVTPLHARLAGLQLHDRGGWRALLADDNPSPADPTGQALNAIVELGAGTPDELAARLQTFVATAAQTAARYQRGVADIKTADLGYPNGYALRLRGVSTSEQPVATNGAARAAARH